MKAILLKTTSAPNCSFTIEERIGGLFKAPYHYHSDYELTLVIKGTGTRFVGNNITHFEDNDLVLLGKNLPHRWHSAGEYYKKGPNISIVLKFDAYFNGIPLFGLPEYYTINQLLKSASRGIKVQGKALANVRKMMEELLSAKPHKRITLLIDILSEIAESDQCEFLSSTEYSHDVKSNDYDRINDVYEYIIKNYLDNVTLEKAASIAHMNQSAFCKYFKKRYGKTLIQVVNEIRINHACNLLLNDDITVAEVCYLSGFNNLSNFTKIFKKVIKYSPKEYQKKMANKFAPHLNVVK